jgi:hypothetical protein
MPMARCRFATCSIGSDIYVFGGVSDSYHLEASVFKYDTETNEWITLPSMPLACAWISASVLDAQVYIVGAGMNGRDVLRFDPVSAAWSTQAPTKDSRKEGASFVLDGCLFAAGGPVSSVERYDVASNTWLAVATMLEGRRNCGAVAIGSTGPAEEQDLFDSLIDKASRECP